MTPMDIFLVRLTTVHCLVLLHQHNMSLITMLLELTVVIHHNTDQKKKKKKVIFSFIFPFLLFTHFLTDVTPSSPDYAYQPISPQCETIEDSSFRPASFIYEEILSILKDFDKRSQTLSR